MTEKKSNKTSALTATSSQRNHGIDLIRGICILGVIWHHTCLYSGGNFVPDFMIQSSFLLEVPALFFVSGITYKYINRNIIIGNLMKLSFSFTLIALILNILFGTVTLSSILDPLFLIGFHIPEKFSVLTGSYWFVPIYAVILISASILIKKMHRIYPLIMLICFGIYMLPDSVLPLSTFYFCLLAGWTKGLFFLLGFFLLGYFYLEHPTFQKHRHHSAIIILLIGILVYSLCYIEMGNHVFELWHAKDFKSMPYISASLLSIACLVALYTPERKNRFLERIGANSIFYYIGQGISSSFLKLIEPHVNIFWGTKLILFFAVNIIMCIIISEIYMCIYKGIGFLYHKIDKENV